MPPSKKLITHQKVARKQIRRTVDALTRITTADPVSFLTEVMQGKPFLAADPKNPTKNRKVFPTREQRILVAMWLGSRVVPAAKGQSPAAGDVNVIIRSRHAHEPAPLNAPARYSQEIIDATPTEEPRAARSSHRASARDAADGGAEVEVQVRRQENFTQDT